MKSNGGAGIYVLFLIFKAGVSGEVDDYRELFTVDDSTSLTSPLAAAGDSW
jgi:hypothetical protein